MIAVTYHLASHAMKALQRFVRAVIEARMRRVQQEIELHRRFGA